MSRRRERRRPRMSEEERAQARAISPIERRRVADWVWLIGGLMMVLPTGILFVPPFDWDARWLAAGWVVISLMAYGAVRMDKFHAVRGAWRTPESNLHLLELLGGWPGSFLAQRRFHHKVSKRSYQMVFWAIVLLWQYVAFECLSGLALTRRLLTWVEQFT